ncbi:MAG: glycerol-3-phosphate dehydrogenase C-terminal domain-containing protein, partial [Pseudomonadota bacterium]
RKLAEHAVDELKAVFPDMRRTWTAETPLPGGDMPGADFEAFLADLQEAYPWLPRKLAQHYARLYGTKADDIIGNSTSLMDLGQHFGALLYEAEVRHLIRTEWAQSPEDILVRRTKHGLHMSAVEKTELEDWFNDRMARTA